MHLENSISGSYFVVGVQNLCSLQLCFHRLFDTISMIVSEQLNDTKIRWFHAIFMPDIIEFSRCIGTYLSAKLELVNYIKNIRTFCVDKSTKEWRRV